MSREATPLERYDHAAEASAAVVIGRYSTSFGAAARLLDPNARRRIRSIYALVRVADEVVDGTARAAGLDDGELLDVLDELESETETAMRRGYSANLVVHAFALTARDAGIGEQLTRPFFASMRRDLDPSPIRAEEVGPYIHGSAEVVGLMCLAVFLMEEPPDAGRRSEGAAAPGVEVLGEVRRPDRAAHDDALREVGGAGRRGDAGDGAVGRVLDEPVAGAVLAAAADRHVGRDRDEDEQVRVAGRCDGRVRGARHAGVERRRIGDARVVAEDAVEVRVPVLGEEQRVVGEPGNVPAHAEHREDRTGTRGPSFPPRFGIRLRVQGEQLGLGVVQVGGRHDPVGCGAMQRPGGVDVAHARDRGRRIARHLDGLDSCLRHQLDARGRGDPGDPGHEVTEPALRVEHALLEVHVAHEVVHRGRGRGRRPEEHRGISEHLAEPAVANRVRGEPVERRGEQARQAAGPPEHLRREERTGVVEVRVEEAPHRHVVGRGGRVEVALERCAGAGLDRLEECDVLVARGAHVERRVVPVGVHAVAGVESHEVELLRCTRAEHAEEVVEDVGHQVPRRTRVEPEAPPLPRAGAPAQLAPGLEQRDVMPVAGEQRRRRQPGDAAADDHDALGCRGHRPIPPGAMADRTAIASFSGSGTRMRVAMSCSAGVSRQRSASREKRPCAAATAARARRGSSRIVRPEISRSRSMSARMSALSDSVNASGSTHGK